jgi:hypothetical protein
MNSLYLLEAPFLSLSFSLFFLLVISFSLFSILSSDGKHFGVLSLWVQPLPFLARAIIVPMAGSTGNARC